MLNYKLILISLFLFSFAGCMPGTYTVDGDVGVQTNLFGVPDTFTKETANQEPFGVLKGGINSFRLRPEIINEHAESSRDVKGIVTPTNSMGQIFRASQDNINSIYLTLSSSQTAPIDDFESYNSDAEIQAVWVESVSYRKATLETTLVKDGNNAIAMPGDTTGASWTHSFGPTDFTGYTGSFDAQFTKEYSSFKVSVFIGDGTNTKSADLVFNSVDTWIHFDIDESAMTEDGAGTTNTSIITKIGFKITDRDGGEFIYLDNLEATPLGGDVGVTLWNMGDTLPTDGVTSLDDGTQYTQIGDITDTTPVSQYEFSLSGGKRLYHLHYFATGVALEIPGNELLIPGNYYALVINYVDTPVNVYGANFNTDYYKSGYAFFTPDTSTPITQVGLIDDLMFSIFSTQDVYLTKSVAIANSLPGEDANYMSSVEDYNMTTTDIVITHGVHIGQQGEVSFTDRPIFLPKGGKFNLDYNDDATDDVTKIVFGMRYLYEPPVVWG